jgi:gamma-glutamylcyclotransferase
MLLNHLEENFMSQNVFAYGSNMCLGRFRAYRVRPEGAGRGAVLTGYRLMFNKESTDGSGKANVEAHEGSETRGVVYVISDADLRTLDDGEVGYRRVRLPVHATDDVESMAWVYIAITPNNEAALRPYTWYKRFLVEGAREHALPANYIANLENIAAVQDTDAARDGRKRALGLQ